ncbi:MAG: HD domain-containing protein [Desulfobulbaceae bacterium]|nr:HD domain-containing protein [Desulfobulbaceae bacterium]
MAQTKIEKSILTTIDSLQQLKDINSILDTVLLEARKLANADAGTIFLATQSGLMFNYVQMNKASVQTDIIASHYRYYTIPIDKNSIVGYCAATGEEVTIKDAYDLPPDVPFSFNSYFDRKTGYRTRSVFALPLKTLGNKLVGVLELINALDKNNAPIPFKKNIREYVSRFAGYASAAIERGQWNQELILRMIRMAELRDPGETAAHVQRVSAISAEIYTRWAKNRNIDSVAIQQFNDLLRPAAMLHDVGKIGIPDEILKKPGSLTNDEFELIKLHTIYGANLFETSTSELDQICREIALNHHERWDGEGYPGHFTGCIVLFDKNKKPKKGEDIPLAARIVALADVFDALANKRVYKKAWDRKEIYSFIRDEAGGHFDPELVDAFFQITDIVEAIQERYKDISQSSGIKSPSAGALKNPNIVREQQLACGCPEDIFKEIKFIISLMVDDFDYDFLDLCFGNTERIFNGRFPGYQASKTSYHNLDHTMAVSLALIRLVHGIYLQNKTAFAPEIIECGVISAFFHDTGLIQKTVDKHGTGAKYIKYHEERSILFVHEYLKSVGRTDRMCNCCAQIIQCTKLSNAPSQLHFDSDQVKLMGYILGTADIIAQMADRVYLERLPLLLDELKEGGVAGYDSTVDIYHQTSTFFKEVIRNRLYVEFDGIVEAMSHHFMDRWNIDQNLYVTAIENNINYIEYLNKTCPQDKNFYRQYLRRQINY